MQVGARMRFPRRRWKDSPGPGRRSWRRPACGSTRSTPATWTPTCTGPRSRMPTRPSWRDPTTWPWRSSGWRPPPRRISPAGAWRRLPLVVSPLKPLRALPVELRANLPAELRGRRRDGVRLMVIDRAARTIDHADLTRLGSFLRAGDLLVVNRSRTIPAAVPASREGGALIQLRICVRPEGEWHVLAVQPDPPHANVTLRAGERLRVDGVETIVRGRRSHLPLLWRIDAPGDRLERALPTGVPIRYSYVPSPVPASHYQTVYSTDPGSSETPSARLSFNWELLLALGRQGSAP